MIQYFSCVQTLMCGLLLENESVFRGLTGTWPLMMTSSAKRTFTGLDFNLAFLAALMKADLGDLRKGGEKHKGKKDR